MEKNRGVIRELLKYEFELGHSEKEALDNINRAKGHGKVDRTTVWRWFSKFRNNQIEITDKKRAGHPRKVHRVAVVNAVNAESHVVRVVGQTWKDFLGAFGAGKGG